MAKSMYKHHRRGYFTPAPRGTHVRLHQMKALKALPPMMRGWWWLGGCDKNGDGTASAFTRRREVFRRVIRRGYLGPMTRA
jgi:hypothetical protein